MNPNNDHNVRYHRTPPEYKPSFIAIFLALLTIGLITVAALALFGNDKAGAQPNEKNPVACLQQMRNIEFVYGSSPYDDSREAWEGVPLKSVFIGVSWEWNNEQSAQGCTDVGIALYSHPDNASDRPHPDSTLVWSAMWEGGDTFLYAQLPATLPECGWQIDAFTGQVIESFASGDRYGPPRNRLIGAANYVNPDSTCAPVPPTVPTTPPTALPPPTTEPPVTTVPTSTTLAPTTSALATSVTLTSTTTSTEYEGCGGDSSCKLPATGSGLEHLVLGGLAAIAMGGISLLSARRRGVLS